MAFLRGVLVGTGIDWLVHGRGHLSGTGVVPGDTNPSFDAPSPVADEIVCPVRLRCRRRPPVTLG
jgi:hypothetical protein